MKFDVVVGNPPYQPPNPKTKNKGKTIWDSFVVLGINLAKPDGHISLVTPAGWRSPINKLHNAMFRDITPLYLSIHDNKDGVQTFGGGDVNTRYDWYVLRNHPNVAGYKTTIRFEDTKIDKVAMSDLPLLSNCEWDIWSRSIELAKTRGTILAIRDQSFNPAARPDIVSKTEITNGFPLVKSVSDKGPEFFYSTIEHPVQRQPKVIFSNARHIYPFYDSGKLGVCDGAVYVAVKNKAEADILIRFLTSTICRRLVSSTKWNNFATIEKIFHFMPMPADVGLTAESSDEEIETLFRKQT